MTAQALSRQSASYGSPYAQQTDQQGHEGAANEQGEPAPDWARPMQEVLELYADSQRRVERLVGKLTGLVLVNSALVVCLTVGFALEDVWGRLDAWSSAFVVAAGVIAIATLTIATLGGRADRAERKRRTAFRTKLREADAQSFSQ